MNKSERLHTFKDPFFELFIWSILSFKPKVNWLCVCMCVCVMFVFVVCVCLLCLCAFVFVSVCVGESLKDNIDEEGKKRRK